MSEKWTPGPWWVEIGEGDDDDGFLYIAHEGTESPDTTVCALEGDGQHDIANAHLIAAAPELFAALERLYGKLLMSDRDGEVRITEEDGEMARTALAKARGES